jgi:hypothetical protein
MKLIALTAALATMVGFASANTYTYSDNLKALYGIICTPHDQKIDLNYDAVTKVYTDSGSKYIDNSIFQFVTGYSLGTLAQQNITGSSCFVQA